MHGVFDIVGPVMIGPSSSHTAGAVRLGLMARKILGEPAVRADINLHGSFAQTYRGHGTDKALIAGILGLRPTTSASARPCSSLRRRASATASRRSISSRRTRTRPSST